MSYLKNQNGIVGIVLLAAVLVATIVDAGYYVYQVRSGESTAVTDSSQGSGATVKAKTPIEIKEDADAAAADTAGRAAEMEKLNDIGVDDEEF